MRYMTSIALFTLVLSGIEMGSWVRSAPVQSSGTTLRSPSEQVVARRRSYRGTGRRIIMAIAPIEHPLQGH